MNTSKFNFLWLCIAMGINAATIQSAGNGNWDDTLTWIGHKIPGASDNVTINATVSITSAAACNDLTISTGAILQNGGSYGWVTPRFNGSITNNGTIRNNPAGNQLWLEIYGNMTNNGTWSPTKTLLGSSRSQTITQGTGAVFTGQFSIQTNDNISDTTRLIAGSDLTFNAVSMENQGYVPSTAKYFWKIVDLSGHNLTLTNKSAFFRAVLKNAGTITSQDTSIMYDLSFQTPVTLAGETNLTNAAVTFNETTTITGILQNAGSYGWLTPTFNGTLINNGTIRNNPLGNQLWLDLYGDFTNNGIWAPAKTTLGSDHPQTISQSAGKVFTGIFSISSTSRTSDTATLMAGTDLVFSTMSMENLGYIPATAKYFWRTFDLKGHNLTLSHQSSLFRAVIKNAATITSQDTSILYDLSFETPVTLAGETNLTNTNVTFNGTTTNAGILQNAGSYGWLIPVFNGTFINNGTVRNNPAGNAIQLDLRGNIINNGTWIPQKTLIPTKQNQIISQADGTEFTGTFRRTDGSGYSDTMTLTAASNLVFNKTSFDGMGYVSGATSPYFWGKMNMGGYTLTLKGTTDFGRAVLSNCAAIYSPDSATLYDISVNNPIVLRGRNTFTNSSVYFNDLVTNADTIQNGGSYGWLTVNFLKGITNHGVIRNNPAGNAFLTSIGGNAINNGTWINGGNTFADSVNQEITLISGKPIKAPIKLQSEWATGPYSWKKNGVDPILSYERNAPFDSLTAANYGTYRCSNGTINSRTITLKNGDPSPIKTPAEEIIPKAISWSINHRSIIQISTTEPIMFSIRIFDLRGRDVFTREGSGNSGNYQIDLGKSLANGVYILKLSLNNIRVMQKIHVDR